jgi:SAM-dependent methyltransferase
MEMRLRARMPRAARLVYRFARSFQPVVPSKYLPDDLVRDCRFCSSRLAMLDFLPRNGCVAELGTYKGDFAREILARNTPKELHLVDVDYSLFDRALLADVRVIRHDGLTDAIIAKFQDGYFDWIYVDAGHSYAAVLADANSCVAKLKPGGFLVFNDFGHIDPFLGRYGVHRAVVDFAAELGWPFRFFAFQEYAMYDVALQKPERGA